MPSWFTYLTMFPNRIYSEWLTNSIAIGRLASEFPYRRQQCTWYRVDTLCNRIHHRKSVLDPKADTYVPDNAWHSRPLTPYKLSPWTLLITDHYVEETV